MASLRSATVSPPQLEEVPFIGTIKLVRTDSVQYYPPVQIFPGKDIRFGRDPWKQYVNTDSDVLGCETQAYLLEHPLVSKDHFRIYSVIYDIDSPGQYPPLVFCEDLQTTNGTYVNDLLIGKMGSDRGPFLLSNNDVISIRPFWTFQFHQQATLGKCLNDLQAKESRSFEKLYTISPRVLGCGTRGAVYLAKDELAKQQLACKVVDLRTFRDETSDHFLIDTPKDEKSMTRAFREVQLLQDLDHPNIISIKKAFYSPHSLYLFFELATGGDLFSYLQSEGGTISEVHARVITRQLAKAIDYIHSQGVAHRDIKPENILAMRTDIGHRVVLTDFDCATSFVAPAGNMVSQVGTDGYAAPEVYRQHGYTQAVDLWSLGIVLVTMFTGDTLVSVADRASFSQREMAAKLLIDDPHTWSCRPWDTVGVQPKDLISRLLIINPADRLTASETANHSWFCKPTFVQEELKNLDRRALCRWMPRPFNSKIIEELPGVSPLGATPSRRRQIRNVPDAMASAYFSLDRHLSAHAQSQSLSQQRSPPDDMASVGYSCASTNAGDPSGTTEYFEKKSQRTTSYHLQAKEVDDSDIFEKRSLKVYAAEANAASHDTDSMVITKKAKYNPIVLGTTSSNHDAVHSLSMEEQPKVLDAPQIPKLPRSYTECSSDRVLFDEVSRSMPGITSAKTFKQAVAERKALRQSYYHIS